MPACASREMATSAVRRAIWYDAQFWAARTSIFDSESMIHREPRGGIVATRLDIAAKPCDSAGLCKRRGDCCEQISYLGADSGCGSAAKRARREVTFRSER